MDKTCTALGIILLAGGIAFSFLPHDAHNMILGYVTHGHSHEDSHGDHGGHDLHINIGWGVAIAGLALAVLGYYRKK
jgi:hypothetical protein